MKAKTTNLWTVHKTWAQAERINWASGYGPNTGFFNNLNRFIQTT